MKKTTYEAWYEDERSHTIAQRKYNKQLEAMDDLWVICPYSRSQNHMFPRHRLHYHLIQCAEKPHVKDAVASCTERANHFIINGKLSEHLASCPDAKKANQAKEEVDLKREREEGFTEVQPSKRIKTEVTSERKPEFASNTNREVEDGEIVETPVRKVRLELKSLCRSCSSQVSFDEYYCKSCYCLNPQLFTKDTKSFVSNLDGGYRDFLMDVIRGHKWRRVQEDDLDRT